MKVAFPRSFLLLFRLRYTYSVQNRYNVEFVTYLWGQSKAIYAGNDHADQLVVRKEISTLDPAEYKGFIFVGG